MKILLVGEFSGLHKELKKGLVQIGHEVTILAAGDGWKEMDCDIKIPSGNGFFSKFRAATQQYRLVLSLNNYDVVQFIYPHIFNRLINSYFINLLIGQNKSSFLVAAGSDAFYWKDFKNKFRYSPHEDNLLIDLFGKRGVGGEVWFMDWNRQMALSVNAIVPVAYDYKVGYAEFKNVAPTVPMPFSTSYIKPRYFDRQSKKIVVLHGISRSGFKGSRFINEALDRLQNNYEGIVEIVRPERLSYSTYKEVLSKADIVVDQALSYSYGMNALLSLSMGKITLSGAEPECLLELGVESCPIINILPSVDDIYLKLEKLISDREQMLQISLESRRYVERIHESKIIAERFINTWKSYE